MFTFLKRGTFHHAADNSVNTNDDKIVRKVDNLVTVLISSAVILTRVTQITCIFHTLLKVTLMSKLFTVKYDGKT